MKPLVNPVTARDEDYCLIPPSRMKNVNSLPKLEFVWVSQAFGIGLDLLVASFGSSDLRSLRHLDEVEEAHHRSLADVNTGRSTRKKFRWYQYQLPARWNLEHACMIER